MKVSDIKISEKPTHFRVVDELAYGYDNEFHFEHTSVQLKIVGFYTIHETECFSWVVTEWVKEGYLKGWLNANNLILSARKVGKKATRSYCHQNFEDAKRSFIARKEKQLEHCRRGMSKATLSLEQVSNLTIDNQTVDCGTDNYLKTIFISEY